MHKSWAVALTVALLIVALVGTAHAFPNAGEPDPEDYDSSIETSSLPWPVILVIVGVPVAVFLYAVISTELSVRRAARSSGDVVARPDDESRE